MPATTNPAITARNHTIAQERLSGKSYHKIAKKLGIPKSTVQYIIKNDNAVKDVLEQGERELICMIPSAVNNYRTFLLSEDESIKLKASQDILKTTRILATQSDPPVYIQNLYNQVNQILLSGDYDRYLKYKQESESKYIFNVIPEDKNEV